VVSGVKKKKKKERKKEGDEHATAERGYYGEHVPETTNPKQEEGLDGGN